MFDTVTTLADLVPRASARGADDLALIGFDSKLTWAEAHGQTTALASTLVAAGLQRGDRVALAMNKTHHSFLAVHAILRAGGVVVPIDPLAPSDAAALVIYDADVAGAIGDRRTFDRFGLRGRQWPTVGVVAEADDLDAHEVSWDTAVGHPPVPLPPVDTGDPAYIIYTSGSTGRSKGIVHTHGSGLAYAQLAATEYGIRAEDRVAGMNPMHFDMSTLELYAAPMVGAATVVMGELHMRFPASFASRCAEHGVSVWYGVPFFLNQLADRGGLDRVDLTSLRLLMWGGEPYTPGAIAALLAQLPAVHVVNVYGPAEVNACTHFHFDSLAELEPWDTIPIGRPWPGAVVDVRDDTGAPVAPGDQGELWVAADTAMQGYWRRDDLTADRTVGRDGGSAWYRTGDVVREVGGELVYLGRVDHQVKVRGVRIELEGVEAVLTDAPGVAHAVAGAVGDGHELTHIAAVIIPEAGVSPDLDEVTAWCSGRLAAVAVPTRLTITDHFPSTASGKIDRRRVRADLQAGAPT